LKKKLIIKNKIKKELFIAIEVCDVLARPICVISLRQHRDTGHVETVANCVYRSEDLAASRFELQTFSNTRHAR